MSARDRDDNKLAKSREHFFTKQMLFSYFVDNLVSSFSPAMVSQEVSHLVLN